MLTRCAIMRPTSGLSGRSYITHRTPWTKASIYAISRVRDHGSCSSKGFLSRNVRPENLTISKSSQLQRCKSLPLSLPKYSHTRDNSGIPAQDALSSALAPYQPPTTGLISYLPRSFIPYAELMRLDKPTGTYYLFFPCLFSTLVAATMTTPIVAPSSVVGTSLLFLTGALIMRGAGCTINDLWDRNLDPHVERTRLRPIARRAVSPQQAIVFLGGQLSAGLAVLLSFPLECFWYATPSLLLVATYPLAKRVTYYPQFVLGLTFSWGAMMGFPALGVDLLANQAALTAAACLYASNVAWTVLYDMIYAHMDIKDDVKAGIKSIALKHEKETKAVLSGLAVVQLGLLGSVGVAAGLGPIFFIGSCGGAALTLGTMIRRVKLKEVKNCWWWFVNGAWFTGGAISLGLAGEYLARWLGWYEDQRELIESGQRLVSA